MKPKKNHAISGFGKESLPKSMIDYLPVRNRILTRDDLMGRTAMSYLRFSTLRQHEKYGGSSTDRQQEIRDEMVAEFKLVPHERWFFADKGISGGGKHRRKGQFRMLCEMLGFDAETLADIIDDTGKPKESEIPEGIVLLIESPSRFSRERYNDYMPLLTKILERGIIILYHTMREMPWTLERLNRTQDRMFLQMMMDAAHEENAEKSRRMKKSHRRKLELVASKQSGEKAPLPWVNPPAWITRTGTFDNPRYTMKEADKRTAMAMFRLLADPALTYFGVAEKLNADTKKYRWFGQLRQGKKPEDMRWTAARIWQLANDPRMIGVRKCYEDDGQSTTSRGKYTGIEGQIFPAAISQELWDKVHQARPLAKYNTASGEIHCSLFSHKLFCGCKQRLALRCTERDRHRDKSTMHRTLQCVSVMAGGKGCRKHTQYPLIHYEPLILRAIGEEIAPHRASEQRPIIERRIHTLQSEQRELEGRMDELTSSSDSARNRRRHIQTQIDQKEDEIKVLISQLVTTKAAASRKDDVKRFLETDVAKAVAGDITARKRIRRMIATLDFRIEAKDGTLTVLLPESKKPIILPKPTKTSYRIRVRPPHPHKPGDKLRVNGELLTYVCKGTWRAKDGSSRRLRSRYDVYRRWTEERRRDEIVSYDSRSGLFKGLEVYVCKSLEKAVVPDGAKMRYTGRGCFEVL